MECEGEYYDILEEYLDECNLSNEDIDHIFRFLKGNELALLISSASKNPSCDAV